MKKFFFFILITSFFCVACDEVNVIVPVKHSTGPIMLSQKLQKRVSQDNEFALDLLKNTIKVSDESNVFISPLSVSIALGMAWNGADGLTKSEMAATLKMDGMAAEDINEYYKIMIESLPTADSCSILNIANSVWCRDIFQAKQPFLDINATYFNAEIRKLDFSKTWAVDTINNWCARKTNNLIKDVIKQIDPLAMMYLINAVYFKGQWTNKFDVKNTFESDFKNEQGNLNKVNMMQMTDSFPYYSDSYAQYLEMPYGNGAFSMTVILPEDGKTTNDLLDYLTSESLNSIFKELKSQQVIVSFPRFKAESDYELSEPLKAMGMMEAFKESANFSGICDIDLYINSVIHKTYVEVTEEGTEAAAVTVVEFFTTSLPDYPCFNANKPFIFLIREKGTGVILFAGKMGSVEKY